MPANVRYQKWYSPVTVLGAGLVRAASREAEGSTFFFELPLAARGVIEAAEAASRRLVGLASSQPEEETR